MIAWEGVWRDRAENRPACGGCAMTMQPDIASVATRAARVALVDDDGVFLKLLAENLRAGGLDPICYTDPELALAALRKPPSPDACILDWNMPGIDGLALL